MATGRPVASLRGHTDDVATARFSPGGERVVTGGTDRSARIWDAPPGVAELRARGLHATDAALSADGSRVVAAGRDGERLRSGTRPRAPLSRLDASRHLASGPAPSPLALACRRVLGCRALDPRGERVVVALADGSVRIWSARSGHLVRRLARRGAPYTAAAFGPDGRLVVATGDTGSIDVWDATRAGDEPIARLAGPADGVQSAELSRDARRVLTIDRAGHAALWAVAGEPRVAGSRAPGATRWRPRRSTLPGAGS